MKAVRTSEVRASLTPFVKVPAILCGRGLIIGLEENIELMLSYFISIDCKIAIWRPRVLHLTSDLITIMIHWS
jgi:hypothetical protein